MLKLRRKVNSTQKRGEQHYQETQRADHSRKFSKMLCTQFGLSLSKNQLLNISSIFNTVFYSSTLGTFPHVLI